MGPKFKDQEVRGQVNTTFSEATNWGLIVSERNSVVADGNLALFQCFFFRTNFFGFVPVFQCHAPKREKKQLNISMKNFQGEILKKKSSKNLKEQKRSLDPQNFR